ncbi:MAG TPA: NFACT family protein [Pyrinomonadaceae bacterium]|nr:NFACT family protein [Pyrinomonadaceae bacterium]
MNIELIENLVPELRQALIGSSFRAVFQLGPDDIALAFDGEEFRLLFISIRPGDPRIYLIHRRLRDLKRLSIYPSQFAITLEKTLSGAKARELYQLGKDRVIEIVFSEHKVIVQLTGKSANLFLLDLEGKIIAAAKKPKGEGQTIGSKYAISAAPERDRPVAGQFIGPISNDTTISGALDEYYRSLDERREFEDLSAASRTKNRQEIAKLNRLVKNLKDDLAEHGDAEKWKRFGDLLLANQSSAERNGGVVLATDLFDEGAPVIEIEADETDSIAEAAQKYFRRYTKARNARRAIESRLNDTQVELRRLEKRGQTIEKAIADHDEVFLNSLVRKKRPETQRPGRKGPKIPSGIRTFTSTDGFEILVGKKATDNDHLTSRVANSRDTWMHAADYPGSHVVIRNPDKKEVPHRTLIEAAQLAAFYSQGKKQPKAAVHHTLKKFVTKPKGAAPGLVRLASFKTILVEPKIGHVKPVIR